MYPIRRLPGKILAQVMQWQIQEGLALAGYRLQTWYFNSSRQLDEKYSRMPFVGYEAGNIRWATGSAWQQDSVKKVKDDN